MSEKEQNTESGAEIKTQLFHEYLEDKINASSIKQIDMANALGFEKPNIISMFKQGKTRVPLSKVPAFAKVLGLDPKALLRRAMSEYDPLLLKVVEATFGSAISRNEFEIIEEIRRLSRCSDPRLSSIESKEALSAFVDSLLAKSH